MRSRLYRILGTELTQIDGTQVTTAQTIFAELGLEVSKFAAANGFAHGRVYVPTTKSAVAKFSLSGRDPGRTVWLKLFEWRPSRYGKSILSRPLLLKNASSTRNSQGNSTAHKPAKIVYHLLKIGNSFDETVFAEQEELHKNAWRKKCGNR